MRARSRHASAACSIGVLLWAGGADYGRIHAVTFGPEPDFVHEILLADDDDAFRAHRFGNTAARGQKINRKHSRAGCLEKIRDEQADQALPHHQDAVPQARFGLANGVKGNRAKRCVSGLPICNFLRNWRGEHVRHRDIFRVKGAFRPAARDAITDSKRPLRFIHRDDDPGGAIAKRARRFKPVANFVQGAPPAHVSGDFHDFAHLVWTRFGLLEQVHARLLHLHLFRAGADHRVRDAHENASGRGRRLRHLLQLDPAILILGDLFHNFRT